MGRLTILIIPLLILASLVEAALYRQSGRGDYPWMDSTASLLVHVGDLLSNTLTGGIVALCFQFAYRHRLFTISINNLGKAIALFLVVELIYYWQHRMMHQVRWLWAYHSVHHSPPTLTLSSAYRLGWFAAFSGAWVFLIPLSLLGIHPMAVGLTISLNLLYQFWLHTDLVPKLGLFELLFNTPSHHRVHHAINPRYLDQNYGGILIVFDRLFGTFVREEERCQYGLVRPLTTLNPFRIALNEVMQTIRDVVRAPNWTARWHFLFDAPGWSPDGSRKTSAQIRAESERTVPPKMLAKAMARGSRLASLSFAAALLVMVAATVAGFENPQVRTQVYSKYLTRTLHLTAAQRSELEKIREAVLREGDSSSQTVDAPEQKLREQLCSGRAIGGIQLSLTGKQRQRLLED